MKLEQVFIVEGTDIELKVKGIEKNSCVVDVIGNKQVKQGDRVKTKEQDKKGK